MKKTILFAIAILFTVTAFSQETKTAKPVTDTTTKPAKDTTKPKMLAIIISENDWQVLSALLSRGISEAQKDPVTNSQQAQFHNALPTIRDFLLKNTISVDNLFGGTGVSVADKKKK